MFGKLNEQAASALLSLEPGDLSYCLKLAKRFEHMGIESDQARSLRAASWRRSTRRGKRMQSNVEAVFGSGRRPHDLLGFERIMRATARSLRFPHVKSSC